MSDIRELKDEVLEKVTGGGEFYYPDTLPQGAIIFNYPPDYLLFTEHTCANIAFDGYACGKIMEEFVKTVHVAIIIMKMVILISVVFALQDLEKLISIYGPAE